MNDFDLNEMIPRQAYRELRDERDYWKAIARIIAPEYPVVAIPVDTLNEISERAEDAGALLKEVAEWIDFMEHPGPLAIATRQKIKEYFKK